MKWNGVNIGDKIRQNSNVVKAISYLNGTFTFTKGDDTTQEISTGGGSSNTLDGELLEVVTRDSAYGAGSLEGQVVKFGSGTLSTGKGYILGSSGWVECNANTESSVKGLFGIALGTSATSDGVLVRGIRAVSNAYTAGDILYIDLSGGLITNSLSSHTTGDFVRVIGYALSTQYIYINPSPDYLEIA